MIRHFLLLLLLTFFYFASARVTNTEYMDDLLRNDFQNFLKERLHFVAGLNHTTPLRYLHATISLVECDEWLTQHVEIVKPQTTLTEEACGTVRMYEFCNLNRKQTVTMMMKSNGTSIMGQFVCALDNVRMPVSIKEYILTRMIIPLFVFSVVAYVMHNFRKMCKEKSEQNKLAPAINTIIDNSMDTITLDSSRGDKSRKELARFDEDSEPSIRTLGASREEHSRNQFARFDEDSDPSIGTLFTL